MTSKEAIKELYKERAYLLGDKVASKTPSWCEDIKHYDHINDCLISIENELEVLEIIKKCPISALFDYSKTYEEWCNDVCDTDIVKKYIFTKEKYDLVKEWIENSTQLI